MIEHAAACAEDFHDIARYDVSEDGVTWRPYDPQLDGGRVLHKRIEFAADQDC